MDSAMLIEMIGYLGSIIVVISMLMSSVVKLRIINTIGSVIFTTYAVIIHTYPTALLNFFLIVINVYNLVKLMKTDKHYDLIDGQADDAFLLYLLTYYKDDIEKFFPGILLDVKEADIAYIICCESNPAGIFLGKKVKEGVYDILLDYSTPAYRDCSVGEFLYATMAKRGIQELRFSMKAELHVAYLKRMGYVLEENVYVKKCV